MFCPNCGQERVSEATKFCARCGYLLTGTEELLHRGGALESQLPAEPTPPSAKARGVKMGIFMMLLAVVLVPILGILLTFGLGMRTPWPIGLVLFLLGGGGLLRTAYAVMFEEGAAAKLGSGASANIYRGPAEIGGAAAVGALPPQRANSAADYTAGRTGVWRDTNDLEPTTVTDETTKLLEKNEEWWVDEKKVRK
jgi:hypothetical protein